MASLKEVAKEAGVSIATVSHVINDTRYVSPELVARVRAAMAALNYTPNLLARSLRTRRTHTLGFVTADMTNPFYPAVAKGAALAAARRGYNLVLVDSDDNPKIEEETTRVLLQKRVEGLMFTSIAFDSHVPAWLEETGTPFVLINRRAETKAGLYVGLDNEGGVIAAIEHLVTLGHRRIAFIAGVPSSSAAQARKRGYEEGLRRYGLPLERTWVYEGDYRMGSGYQAARRILALSHRPTAVIAANDAMAFGAWRCFRQAGLAVPGQISLVGFDDIQLASMAPIGLTTVHCPMYAMGATAATKLLDVIEGKPVAERQIELQVRLVIRESTGPAAA